MEGEKQDPYFCEELFQSASSKIILHIIHLFFFFIDLRDVGVGDSARNDNNNKSKWWRLLVSKIESEGREMKVNENEETGEWQRREAFLFSVLSFFGPKNSRVEAPVKSGER